MSNHPHESMNIEGYQELRQRCRKRSRPVKMVSTRTAIVVAAFLIFQLGIIGGILFSKKGASKQVVKVPTGDLNSAHVPGQTAATSSKALLTADSSSPAKSATEAATEILNRKSAPAQKATGMQQPASSVRERQQAPPVHRKVAPAVAMPQEAPEGRKDEAGRAYAAVMRSLAERQKEYPTAARKARIEGRSLIVCIIKRDGSIRHAEVVKTSGNVLLDNAALRSVRTVGTFPKVPDTIQGDEVSFDIPITFRLSD